MVVALTITALLTPHSCRKEGFPNIKLPPTNLLIDPSSTLHISLNTVGGYEYLNNVPPSRGIIVYRLSYDTFMAYERTPPNDPNRCHDGDLYTALVVKSFNMVDTCTNLEYSILDGSLIKGEGKYPVVFYKTHFDGINLRIYN